MPRRELSSIEIVSSAAKQFERSAAAVRQRIFDLPAAVRYFTREVIEEIREDRFLRVFGELSAVTERFEETLGATDSSKGFTYTRGLSAVRTTYTRTGDRRSWEIGDTSEHEFQSVSFLPKQPSSFMYHSRLVNERGETSQEHTITIRPYMYPEVREYMAEALTAITGPVALLHQPHDVPSSDRG